MSYHRIDYEFMNSHRTFITKRSSSWRQEPSGLDGTDVLSVLHEATPVGERADCSEWAGVPVEPLGAGAEWLPGGC